MQAPKGDAHRNKLESLVTNRRKLAENLACCCFGSSTTSPTNNTGSRRQDHMVGQGARVPSCTSSYSVLVSSVVRGPNSGIWIRVRPFVSAFRRMMTLEHIPWVDGTPLYSNTTLQDGWRMINDQGAKNRQTRQRRCVRKCCRAIYRLPQTAPCHQTSP